MLPDRYQLRLCLLSGAACAPSNRGPNLTVSYWQHSTRRLFYARDPLGRRSLLLHFPTPDYPYLVLTSSNNAPNYGWSFEEISADRIHILDLESYIDPLHVPLRQLSRQPPSETSNPHFVSEFSSALLERP